MSSIMQDIRSLYGPIVGAIASTIGRNLIRLGNWLCRGENLMS